MCDFAVSYNAHVSASKTPARKRKASPIVPGLGGRLQGARTTAGMTRAKAAGAMDWSVGALRNYELELACPSLAEVIGLAQIYSVDAIALAFGAPGVATERSGSTSDNDVNGIRWVAREHGPPFPVPASVLRGLSGPLVAVDVCRPHPGVAVYVRGLSPPATGGWAAILTDRGTEVLWLRSTGKVRWTAQPDLMTAAREIPARTILGAVVAVLTKLTAD